MKGRYFETGNNFVQAMEEYIHRYENPNTPEKWEKFFRWAEGKGYCDRIIDVNEN